MVISGLFVGLFVVGSIISAVDGDNATGSGSSASPSVPVSTSTMTVTAEPTVDPTESPSTADPEASGVAATVTRVVDGDTIEVTFGGKILDVRLIGIDTPETVHPTEPVGCYGPAASKFTTDQLAGERVRLELDVERRDQYGRTLAYVWLGEELFNETLVARGFAQVSTYPPNVKYVDRFLAAQRDARSHERGLWGVCLQPAQARAGHRRRRRRQLRPAELSRRVHPSVPAGSGLR